MAFNFSFLRAPWSASALRDEVELLERLVPPSAWPDHTLSNHDNPRTVSRYAPAGDLALGRRRARLAALMLLTLRGTPFLYYGEEIGMADTPIPPERVVDVAGRDPERTPMPWDGSPGGGFTTGEPWLPMGAETAAVNVEAQRADPSSMLAFYRDVIRLRRSTPALRSGSYATVEAMPADVFAYVREAAGERWFVALNFGRSSVAVVPPGEGATRISTDPARPLGERAEERDRARTGGGHRDRARRDPRDDRLMGFAAPTEDPVVVDGAWYRLTTTAGAPLVSLADATGRRWADLRPLASIDTLDGPDETLGVTGPAVERDVEARSTRLIWTLASSRWASKRLILLATEATIEVTVEVQGQGRVTDASILSGRSVVPGADRHGHESRLVRDPVLTFAVGSCAGRPAGDRPRGHRRRVGL